MSPSRDSRTFPHLLHAECAAGRRAEGEAPGVAELRAVLDVARIANLLHPGVSVEAALARVAHGEKPAGQEHQDTGGSATRVANVYQLHRRCPGEPGR
ncbi:MAG: hypothetical protein JWQ48_2374 [Conexibacter sp.]|nr:hypothetical protein [Conexibacter sp.]